MTMGTRENQWQGTHFVHFTRMPPSRRYTPATARVQVPQYDPDSKHQVWPYGMYTVDMTTGFHQMDDMILQATYQQEELFKHVFGVTFVKATYHQNRKAWQTTNLDVLVEHESAGRTPTGLWSRYLAARREALGEQSKKSSRARSGRAK
ncbi:hypothetical protein EDD22DRAFT_883935 [Suillus occidentalis]|nr:hypothetical protein EDD22DRAFT_883935 [Suillus occidentalis]